MAKYICTNIFNCSKADSKEEIEIAAGMEPVCQECGRPLKVVNMPVPPSSRIKLVLLGVGLVALVALGVGGWMVMGKSGARLMARSDAASTSVAVRPQGVPPNDGKLAIDKKAVDGLIKAGPSSNPDATASAQKSVIAREFVKAAIPLMQAGRWAEANEQLNLAKAANPDEPLVYINLAISHFKQDQPKEALTFLETAFNKGFRDFSVLEADSDLKKLTNNESYKALVVRYQAK